MQLIYNLLNNLYYLKAEIEFIPTGNTLFNSWTGSLIRNNFLYSCEQVKAKHETSLLSLINKIPIKSTHPLYQELSGGFPKGFSLSNIQSDSIKLFPSTLCKGETYKFSLFLIGDFTLYHESFFEAIRLMCERGIGHPMTKLILIDIKITKDLYFKDFIPKEASGKENKSPKEIHVFFDTPVNLFRNKKKVNTETSYQDKQNGFPSFYQLARSVTYRLIKLAALYTDASEDLFSKENMQQYDEWLQQATTPVLLAANLRRITIQNTPQKGKSHELKFYGYLGEMEYYGRCEPLLPVLRFGQELGTGNDVVYGMGRYRVE